VPSWVRDRSEYKKKLQFFLKKMKNGIVVVGHTGKGKAKKRKKWGDWRGGQWSGSNVKRRCVVVVGTQKGVRGRKKITKIRPLKTLPMP